MKTLALTAAIITAIAAPAFAQHNPAAQAIFLSEATSDDELAFAPRPGAPEIISTQSFGSNGQAQAIFFAEATSDDELAFPPRRGGIEILSSQSFGANVTAARIFAAENAAGREDE
jgi:hypothetical protein